MIHKNIITFIQVLTHNLIPLILCSLNLILREVSTLVLQVSLLLLLLLRLRVLCLLSYRGRDKLTLITRVLILWLTLFQNSKWYCLTHLSSYTCVSYIYNYTYFEFFSGGNKWVFVGYKTSHSQ